MPPKSKNKGSFERKCGANCHEASNDDAKIIGLKWKKVKAETINKLRDEKIIGKTCNFICADCLEKCSGQPYQIPKSKAKKIMCYHCTAATFFFPILVAQHFFSYFYRILSGIPGNLWEFQKNLGNSQKISGIPRNSREFPYFQKNKKS